MYWTVLKLRDGNRRVSGGPGGGLKLKELELTNDGRLWSLKWTPAPLPIYRDEKGANQVISFCFFFLCLTGLIRVVSLFKLIGRVWMTEEFQAWMDAWAPPKETTP